jgi:muramoyltetrapeptide carboxypeptidase
MLYCVGLIEMKIKPRPLLIPSRLLRGDTIGIVAPASPFDKDKFFRGIAVLESMGFRVSFDDDIFIKNGYLAGTDAQRAGQVNRLFSDKNIKAILCAKGGFGAMRMLSLLDFKSIQRNPKIFMGFSDISALLSAIYANCGLVTFHGPMVTTLAGATNETKESMLGTITSAQRIEIKAKKGVVIKPGSASGPVVGGNLTTLCHLIGTRFAPNFKGHILILEDKGEAVYRIDRMLNQMKLAGSFEALSGLILGSFEACGTLDEICRVFEEAFKDVDIPVLSGFDVGHGEINITIPMGLGATLDTDKQRLAFHRPAIAG